MHSIGRQKLTGHEPNRQDVYQPMGHIDNVFAVQNRRLPIPTHPGVTA